MTHRDTKRSDLCLGRYKTRATRCRRVCLVSGSPFSTSKFDVGQINTLRPATFEVVLVDSGRPVNIDAIVPQRVGTFWILGGGSPSSQMPLPCCRRYNFWTRSFPCKNQDHSARVSRKSTPRHLKGCYYRHSFAHSCVHSFAVSSLSPRTLSFLQVYLAKNG